MTIKDVARKDLDSKEFLKLRQATEKIANTLKKRLKAHLEVLRPLFVPRKMLGTFIKSAATDDVHGSDKAFAELQRRFTAICENPFGLSKQLTPPLPPISNQLECIPYQYDIRLNPEEDRATTITSPTRYILSYQSECPLNRLKSMVGGTESRQPEHMKQSLINHLCIGLFLEKFQELEQLLKDLRYDIEICKLDDLGGLPVVILTAPIQTFLPMNDFIDEVTQLSGIPAFQEIIDFDAVENMTDPLKEEFSSYISV